MRPTSILIVATALLAADAATASRAEPLELLPARFTLPGPAARQALLAERVDPSGRHAGLATGSVAFHSSDANIVKVEGGVAVPVGNGRATVTARAGDGPASSAEVVVSGMDKAAGWGFRNDVQPVLYKAGCSTGACHGALAGQNGFRLSLRGYDDEGDWRSITRHALGRRISLADPSSSLLLRKPAGAVAHKGGVRLPPDSLEFRILGEWIAAGAPGPGADDPRVERIELLPGHTVLKPGAAQPLLVLAHFSDGATRDVTRWAKYTAADSAVATVDDATGLLTVTGHGEGTVTAWFLSKLAVATVTVPYENDVSPDVFARSPRRNLIDDLVLEKLRDLNLPPSPPAGDSEFIRRAHLDTIGVLPTAEETKAFLADPSTDKRDKLIDALLARPEFVDYWAYKWSDLLLVSSRELKPAGMWSYYRWVRERVAANAPWDQFARQLVTARGGTLENGAANFFVIHDNPAEVSETLSVAFLGMSISCAKCHNHPMEKWTNDQYYGMANLFARVRTKSGPGEAQTVVAASEGELAQPLTGKPQPPRPLDGRAVAFDDPRDRREHFADWLTSRNNPYFARAITNRVWANFMGKGLVEAVDDLRLTNPASNEKLLNALAGYLADQRYDLKALMRLILQSQTYQRSGQPVPGNERDARFYARYYPRRLMAEVALDALSQVTGAPTVFKDYPEGWRALQLPDSNVEDPFLQSFGRAERVLTCECERTAEPSMAQALHLANGNTLNAKLERKGNRIDQLIGAGMTDGQIVEDLYLSALARPPTEKEKQQILAVLADAKPAERRQAIEDLYWSVLSSNEFLFNH